MELSLSEEPFAGASEYSDAFPGFPEGLARIYVRFRPQGVDPQLSFLALVDTGAHYCILNEGVAELIRDQLTEDVGEMRLRTAHGPVKGKLYLHRIELLAEVGDNVEFESTILVCLPPHRPGPRHPHPQAERPQAPHPAERPRPTLQAGPRPHQGRRQTGGRDQQPQGQGRRRLLDRAAGELQRQGEVGGGLAVAQLVREAPSSSTPPTRGSRRRSMGFGTATGGTSTVWTLSAEIAADGEGRLVSPAAAM